MLKCDTERIFHVSGFQAVGAAMVPETSWREAPADHLIIGLKELPEEDYLSVTQNNFFFFNGH